MTISSTSRRRRFSFSKNIIQCSMSMIAIFSLIEIIFGTRRAITESMNSALYLPAEFQSKHTIPPVRVMNKDIDDRSQPSKIKNDHDRQRNDAAVPAITNPRMTNKTIRLSEGGDVNAAVIAFHTSKYKRIAYLEENASGIFLRGKTDEATKRRIIEKSKEELEAVDRLLDSEDVSLRDPLYEGECVPMQPWQTTSFPICNMFHELHFITKIITDEFYFYTSGGYNDIFWLNERDKSDDQELALKILIYGTEYTDRNFDRVRRDGLILERLTKSPYGMSIEFCIVRLITGDHCIRPEFSCPLSTFPSHEHIWFLWV